MAHLVPIVFLVFLTICAVAGMVTDYKKRKAALEPLRAAIERGQQLDPAVIERLMTPDRAPRISPVYFKVGGIIVISAGIGLAILAVILNQVDPGVLYPALGAATLVICIGVGLMIAARIVEQHAESERRQHALQPKQGS